MLTQFRIRSAMLAVPLLTAPLSFGAYSYKTSVLFTGATGSTQTNITLAFTFNDAKMKTVANGGQITNLCSRNGANVPCDFIFTDDPTCAAVTGGYTWGFDGNYSATAGTGIGWVKIPSYTTSGLSPTVCIGNSAVSTYQGGAAGAEFDSLTVAAYHFPNGSTLSGTDYSANGWNLTNNASIPASATTGKLDGGAGISGGANLGSSSVNRTGSITMSQWVKPNVSNVYQTLQGKNLVNTSGRDFSMYLSATGTGVVAMDLNSYVEIAVSPAWTVGAWNHIVGVADGTNWKIYLNGALAGQYTQAGVATNTAGRTYRVGADNDGGSGSNFNGVIDEAKVSATARSANWIATEYANQSSPPSLGAFTGFSGSAGFSSVAVY